MFVFVIKLAVQKLSKLVKYANGMIIKFYIGSICLFLPTANHDIMVSSKTNKSDRNITLF